MTQLGRALVPAAYLAAWCLHILRVPWLIISSPGARTMLSRLYRFLCTIGSHVPEPVVIDNPPTAPAYVLLRCSRECGWSRAIAGEQAERWLEEWIR